MFKKLLIIFIASIFALISFELFLKYSPFEYGISSQIYNNVIGREHKKDFSSYKIKDCYKSKYTFDKHGLVKNTTKYNDNKKDVIVIGDSQIEALMVQNQNIIHNSLSKEFNYKYNFMNYGLSGTSPIQQYLIAKNYINFKNSKYFIQFIDLESELSAMLAKNKHSMSRPLAFIEFDSIDKFIVIPPRNKSYFDIVGDILGDYQIYFYINKIRYVLKNTFNTKNPNKNKLNDKPKNMDKNWLYLQGIIYQTKKLLPLNTEYKIVIISNNDNNKVIIKNILDDYNIKFIFLNDLSKDLNITLEGFKCDAHWNDETHKNIARIIKSSKLIE